ncbi:type IV pilus assembly protein PilM [Patescibacteria group bacterium]|nr:type IV pilus assembly protein PilM [Patescibacteria group bacterium]
MVKFKIPFQRFSKFFLKPIPHLTSTNCIGIDVGTSSIKIVELSKIGARVKLENYGETSILTLYKNPFRTFEKNTLLLSSSDIGKIISAILEEAAIRTKTAIFTIPDFSTFFTNIELPQMSKKELPNAVNFAAPQYIPLPLSEVVLDWQLIEGKAGGRSKTKLKILLVAVPHEVINQYRKIAEITKLETKFLEAEAFALLRSLTKTDKITIGLVEIGAQSATCSIVDSGVLKSSHSLNIAGNEMTQSLAKTFSLSYKDAEKLKKKRGISPLLKEVQEQEEDKAAKVILFSVDSILVEVQRIFNNFSRSGKKEVQKVILAGGSAQLPGIREYFSSVLKKEVEIINPFVNIFYPPILEETLKEISPGYAIALGAALRGLE